MPEPDKNLTISQEADPLAVYLAAVRKRADYSSRYEFWENDDVPRLLGAVEAVRKLHQPREITETVVCTEHASGSMWRRSATLAEFRAETKACPDCTERPKVICAHCECPHDLWPCPTHEAITKALPGEIS